MDASDAASGTAVVSVGGAVQDQLIRGGMMSRGEMNARVWSKCVLWCSAKREVALGETLSRQDEESRVLECRRVVASTRVMMCACAGADDGEDGCEDEG